MRLSWMQIAGLLAAGAWITRRALFVVRIDGASMEPTFRSGDAVLAVRAPIGPRVRQGDVVVCRLPAQLQGPTGLLVKRIAGLAGDEIEGIGVIAPGQVLSAGTARAALTRGRSVRCRYQRCVAGWSSNSV